MAFLGIVPDELMKLTFCEYWYALEGKRKILEAQDTIEENRFRNICEIIAATCLHLVNINLDRGKRIRKRSKLFEFPWDKEKKKKTQTVKEMWYAIKAINAIHKMRQSRPKPEIPKIPNRLKNGSITR